MPKLHFRAVPILAVAVVLCTADHEVGAASRIRISTTGQLLPDTPGPTEQQQPDRRRRSQDVDAQQSVFPASDAAPTEEQGASVDEGGRLDLMCFGGGAANKVASATAFGWNSLGYSSTATIVGTRSQGFDDQVSLFIDGADSRIRMPRTMLPIIRGGKDGWFKLHDLNVKPNEITASVGVNALNNPKLRLDRYSGAISISGKAGDFSGQCRRFNPNTQKRAF